MTASTTPFDLARVVSYAAIAVGDLMAMSGFIAYGLLSHAINPFKFPFHAVNTLVPFLLAWTIAAPVGGLYRRETIGSIRSTLIRVPSVWLAVTLIGAAIRSTDLFPGEAPPIFLLTTAVFGLAFVFPWRLAATVIRRRLDGRMRNSTVAT